MINKLKKIDSESHMDYGSFWVFDNVICNHRNHYFI